VGGQHALALELGDQPAGGFHRHVQHGAHFLAGRQPDGFLVVFGEFAELEQQAQHPAPGRAGAQLGQPFVGVVQRALPALHHVAQQGGLVAGQFVQQVARQAADHHLGAGHRVGGVALAQHGFHAHGVAAPGQAQDAALAALVGAFQPHHARAHGVGGLAGLLHAVERFARRQPDLGDLAVDVLQRGLVQGAEQGEPAHPAFRAQAGLGL
jgi:hypothetical protein